MASLPVEADILGLKVTCQPLPFARAEDMLPDVAEFIGIVISRVGGVIRDLSITKLSDLALKDVSELGDAISKLGPIAIDAARFFGAGRLKRLAPLLLATTSVPMPTLDGRLERKELGKDADRSAVFEERPDTYFPILFFAGSVTYKRFFPGGLGDVLRAAATRAPSS